MASFCGHPCGEPDDSGPDPRTGDTGAPELVGPVIFLCGPPCEDGHCGVEDCDHPTYDQLEFATAAAVDAIALMHDGCGCVLAPMEKLPP